MNDQHLRNRRTLRNLSIFTTLVLASGWLGRGLDALMGNPSAESLGMLLWILMPLGVSLLLRAFAGDGWKDFGIRPNFKGNWLWYLVAILVFPLMTALVLMLGSALGWVRFPDLSGITLGLLLQAFALGLVPQFIKNIFEEAPWRGYLAPKVYSLGLHDFAGHAIVGLVWGAWHIPYYLFFLDRAVLSSFSTLDLWIYIPLAIWVMISWAVVYGEIRLLTNSFWPAVLMHMVEDAFLIQLFLGNHIQIVPGTDWLISPMNGLLMSFFFIVLGIGLRQYRKRRMSLASKSNLRSLPEAA
jgi:hypothetical protein